MKKPNVLLVMTDEHAPQVAGFAGDPVAGTEYLDRFAETSVCFPNASCTCPVCTPSRMSMLCGKDAHRCSAWNNHWVIFPEHQTWPGHFADHGYVTALVGKMHFGGGNQMNGFQHRPYGDLRHGLGHQPDPLSLFPGYNNPESAGITEIPESLIQDGVVTREALAFLREQADREPETPWFLCASYGRPHSPLTAPGRYIRRYRDKVPPPSQTAKAGEGLEPFAQRLRFDLTDEQTTRAREAYYACVDFVDDCIGELMDGLTEDGLLENTIVIYTSDHGEMLGRYGCWGKQLYYGASSGIPLLISGPGIAEGQTVAHPISLMDLFPTTCGLTGLPIPEGLNGVDFSDVLRNPQTAASPREFAPSACYRYGVRIGHNAVAEHEPQSAWRSVRSRGWKYVEIEDGDTLLFDLVDDPDETTNLAKLSEHAERCQRMRGALHQNFSWREVHQNLASDRERLPRYLSGLPPGMPNQYQLPDGRVFDAEKSLYDARWLQIPAGCTGGIIPQQFG
ncbi:MAG: sulfatase-like hydrolase/transferase [Kiritimatiellia bacterium]